MFLKFMFLHCCYVEEYCKYWYANEHTQRVYIFIVRKSGKTGGFKCTVKAKNFLKKCNFGFYLGDFIL